MKKLFCFTFIIFLNFTSLAKDPDMEKLETGFGYVAETQYIVLNEEENKGEVFTEVINYLKSGKMSQIDEKYCVGKCLENYKRISEKFKDKFKNNYPLYWSDSLVGKIFSTVYDDKSLTKPLGHIISTSPFIIRIEDEIYTNEEFYEDFIDYIKDAFSLGKFSFTIVDGEDLKYRGIWVHQLKRFVYIDAYVHFLEIDTKENKEVFFKNEPYELGKFHHNNDSAYYSFLDTAVFYDENNKVVRKDDLVGLYPIGYKAEKDFIHFYFYDGRKPLISNKVDNVFIRPEYLLSYYGYNQTLRYKMYKKDILNKDNKPNYYVVGQDYDQGMKRVTCSLNFPKEIESKLRNGTLKIQDLDSIYKSVRTYETENIFLTGGGDRYPIFFWTKEKLESEEGKREETIYIPTKK